MSRRGALAVLIAPVVAAAIGGCSSSTDPNTRSSEPSIAHQTLSPDDVTPSLRSGHGPGSALRPTEWAPCTGSSIQVSSGRPEGATGTTVLPLGVRTTSEPCVLPTFPTVELLDHGAELDVQQNNVAQVPKGYVLLTKETPVDAMLLWGNWCAPEVKNDTVTVRIGTRDFQVPGFGKSPACRPELGDGKTPVAIAPFESSARRVTTDPANTPGADEACQTPTASFNNTFSTKDAASTAQAAVRHWTDVSDRLDYRETAETNVRLALVGADRWGIPRMVLTLFHGSGGWGVARTTACLSETGSGVKCQARLTFGGHEYAPEPRRPGAVTGVGQPLGQGSVEGCFECPGLRGSTRGVIQPVTVYQANEAAYAHEVVLSIQPSTQVFASIEQPK